MVFDMLEAAHQMCSLDDNVARWAIMLIMHARAAILVQQVKETFSLLVAVGFGPIALAQTRESSNRWGMHLPSKHPEEYPGCIQMRPLILFRSSSTVKGLLM